MIRIPDSISATVYTMKHPYLWTLMVWGIAIAGYVLMASASDRFLPLSFASCASIAFVGCLPLIRGGHNTLHWVLGISGCVLSQVWCILVAGPTPIVVWWWLYTYLLVILLYTGHGDQWCFWMEAWCMAAVCGVSFFCIFLS